MKKKPVARKKTAARKTVAKKAAPRKAPKKLAAKPPVRRLRVLAAKPQAAVTMPGAAPEAHKPGLHLPMKPPPAYAQMVQRAWAHKPPPHKLTK